MTTEEGGGPICGAIPKPSQPWGSICSPECARIKAIVDAIDRLTARFPEPLELRAIEHFTIGPSERTQ